MWSCCDPWGFAAECRTKEIGLAVFSDLRSEAKHRDSQPHSRGRKSLGTWLKAEHKPDFQQHVVAGIWGQGGAGTCCETQARRSSLQLVLPALFG